MTGSSILTSPSSCDEELQGTLKYIDAFEITNVTTWSGEDCFRWAQQVCQDQGIDPCSVNLNFFSSVSGCNLVQYSRFDFHSQFDSMWGGLFYEQFHQLLEQMGLVTSTSSTFSDCSSSDASSYSSSSNSPFYENDEELDLCELPLLTVPEDFAELDNFLHQQVPQEQELLVKPQQQQVAWDWEDYQVTSTITSDYESSSSTFSDCSSSDASSYSSSSNSPFYENDEELADLCELPPLTVPEDFAELDNFLHQQVPQEQELLVKPQQQQVAWDWEDYQGDLFAPSEKCLVKAEPKVMNFDESYREMSPSPESVVPCCRAALKKIRTKSRTRDARTSLRRPKNWEFVIRLLADKQYTEVVRWEDKTCYTFRFVRPAVIAKMWGQRSNKPNLSYDHFTRGLRYHYATGALRPMSERLLYQCGPKARKFLEELHQTTW